MNRNNKKEMKIKIKKILRKLKKINKNRIHNNKRKFDDIFFVKFMLKLNKSIKIKI